MAIKYFQAQSLQTFQTLLQFVPHELGYFNFGYPAFTKEINAAAWSFLDEYRVTNVKCPNSFGIHRDFDCV